MSTQTPRSQRELLTQLLQLDEEIRGRLIWTKVQGGSDDDGRKAVEHLRVQRHRLENELMQARLDSAIPLPCREGDMEYLLTA
tara:strand:- start:289 stop:537 length:249 start_codon:yes stop_codon:yes gene_type:complete